MLFHLVFASCLICRTLLILSIISLERLQAVSLYLKDQMQLLMVLRTVFLARLIKGLLETALLHLLVLLIVLNSNVVAAAAVMVVVFCHHPLSQSVRSPGHRHHVAIGL